MSVVLLGSTSGSITLQEPAVAGTNTVNFGANTGVAILDANTPAFRNRILNGSMILDQRNAGASVTPTTTGYTLDRWSVINSVASKFSVQQNAGSLSAANRPVGFTNYLGATSLAATAVSASDYYQINQSIEGFNFADLNWGTANAQPVTLSFWVRSSLTGTFGGTILNAAENRSYPYSYTISAANTWEQKTITIAGDTTGTWVGATNGTGVQVRFSLGMGSTYTTTANAWAAGVFGAPTGSTNVVSTNGATFYVTGVQLEKGSTATSFDYRSYGTEFYLCQRYFQKLSYVSSQIISMGNAFTGANASAGINFPQELRATPSITLPSSGQAGATITFLNGAGSYPTSTGSHAALDINNRCFTVAGSGYTGLTGGQPAWLYPNAPLSILVSAEL
jgi:hypothetical protein